MARTIKEIANGMKADFIGNESLCESFELYYDQDRTEDECIAYYDSNFSAVSVETCLIFIVAACAAALENMFDWFTEDVNRIIGSERYGHKGWYEKTAKEFELQGGSIVTQSSCEEMHFGVKLKVAKGGSGNLQPLSPDELTSFQTYMNRLRPAGIPITYISSNPDILRIETAVYYDPTIYLNDDAAEEVVKRAINNYINGIDFNGVFTTMELVDALQNTPGVDIAEVLSVQAKRAGYGYSDIENGTRYQSYAGYMKLADDEDIIIHLHQSR